MRNQEKRQSRESKGQLVDGNSQLARSTANLDIVYIDCTNIDSLNFDQEQLKQCKTLKVNLESQNIGQEKLIELQSWILEMQGLETMSINLQSNCIDEQKTETIVQMFTSNTLKQVDLNLGQNELGNQGWIMLFRMLSRQNDLESLKLNISENDCDESIIQDLIKMVKSLNNLKELSLQLQDNDFSSTEICKIMKNLKGLQQLTKIHLDFSGYDIDGHTVQFIGQVLQQFNKLTTIKLNLEGSYITDNKLHKLLEQLLSTNLESLDFDLGNNFLTGQCIGQIMNLVQQLQTLKHLKLYLYENKLSSELESHFIQQLCSLDKLETIRVHLDNHEYQETDRNIIMVNQLIHKLASEEN